MTSGGDTMATMIPVKSSDTIVDAMWEGNVTRLHVIAPCKCCCAEHAYASCPARSWNGCRGDWSEATDEESWVRHYRTRHSMTREQFFGEPVLMVRREPYLEYP